MWTDDILILIYYISVLLLIAFDIDIFEVCFYLSGKEANEIVSRWLH